MSPVQQFIDTISLALKGDTQSVFFLVAAYSFILLFYSFIYQVRVSRWPTTTGVLDEGRISEWGAHQRQRGNQNFKLFAACRYEVAGITYDGSRVSPWLVIASANARFLLSKQLNSISRKNENAVLVYYNPRKPKRSFLVKPGRSGMFTTIVLACLPAILYVAEYYI